MRIGLNQTTFVQRLEIGDGISPVNIQGWTVKAKNILCRGKIQYKEPKVGTRKSKEGSMVRVKWD